MGEPNLIAGIAAQAAAQGSPKPGAPRASMSAEQLRGAARVFEAFFLARTLEPMFAGIGAEAPFGGGMAEDLWRSLLVDEYGKAMAKAGGIGMADAMLRGLIGLQEDQAPATASPANPASPAGPGAGAPTPLAHFSNTEIKRP